MFRLLKKPQCQKLSKFSGYRQTDRPTDKPTPRSSDSELKNSIQFTLWMTDDMIDPNQITKV